MDEFYRRDYANIHRGVYALAERATQAYEGARETVARFLNAKEAAEVVFTRNASEALNMVAEPLCRQLKSGDEIVVTQLEHHANLVPWQQAAKRYHLSLKFIPITKDGRVDASSLSRVFSSGTKVVAVSAMSNVLGSITDLAPIIAAAHQAGAVTVVDAAQAAAHVPLDVQSLDCDFLVFTGHKVFGPSGIGVLYGKKEQLERLEPFEFGGGMIQEVTWDSATWTEVPEKFEAGTPPIAEAVGLAAAIDFIQQVGWKNLLAHEAELTRYGLEKLVGVKGLYLVGPLTSDHRGPVFSFTIDGVHPHDLASILDEDGVAVRSGHHCAMPLHRLLGVQATTRASCTIYNTKSDLDRLVEGIKRAQKLFI